MKKMKKAIAFAMVMAFGLVGLTGCGSEGTDTKTTTAEVTSEAADASEDTTTEGAASETIDLSDVKLMNDGVLTVGCEVGYPPFEDFADDGTTPIGYDIDIITEVAKRLGLEVNIINTAWDGIFAGIDVNYDCVCSAVTITAERQKTMIFTTPYINNYQAVVLPKGSDKKIDSFNDLNGLSIAVQKETTSDILMSDYKSTGTIDVEIVANEKVTSCFTQLTNKEVDAVVVDSTVADGYIAKYPDDYEIVYQDESEPEQFGIAMGPDSTALQSAINEALAQMEADGYIKETYDYWFGSATE
ncbi:MAG: transporter substrate-binding domain-containing protein [Coprococcus sp.]